MKAIDLTHSHYFTKFEDYRAVPNLETLILEDCIELSEIHPSIKHLKKLILLNLGNCRSLKKLPEEINGLASLQTLIFYGCSKIEKLPDNFEQLKSLRKLDMIGTGIKYLPSSILLMENLESVDCIEKMKESVIRENIISYRTTGMSYFPSWVLTLTTLELIDCNLTGPEEFPEYFGKLVNLRFLDLSKNPFSVLPPGINGLSKLRYLGLEHCRSLRCLEPELLPSSLEGINVCYCTSLGTFLDPLKPCHLRCLAHCLDCTELVKRQD